LYLIIIDLYFSLSLPCRIIIWRELNFIVSPSNARLLFIWHR
jgi:uncharacterized protein (DUF302 family)